LIFATGRGFSSPDVVIHAADVREFVGGFVFVGCFAGVLREGS